MAEDWRIAFAAANSYERALTVAMPRGAIFWRTLDRQCSVRGDDERVASRLKIMPKLRAAPSLLYHAFLNAGYCEEKSTTASSPGIVFLYAVNPPVVVKPASVLLITALLSTWSAWKDPNAYGSPSANMNAGALVM